MNPATPDNQIPVAVAGLRRLDGELPAAAARGLGQALYVIAGKAEVERMSAGGAKPHPTQLRKITGRLAGSVQVATEIEGERVIGRIGASASYAAWHEFGFKGTVRVKAHNRVIANLSPVKRRALRDREGNVLKLESRRDMARRQKAGSVLFQRVAAHTRTVNYQGRPFIRPTVEENRELIAEKVAAEIEKAARRSTGGDRA